MSKELRPHLKEENIGQLIPVGDTRGALQKAQETASILKEIVEKQGLVVRIGKAKSEHLKFEAWQFLGAAYGFAPKIKRTWWENGVAYAEAVVIRLSDGLEVSSAIASCSPAERNWRGKDKFQLMSMAQTRAASKALRMVLSWVVVLAGYSPTPAEEMIEEAEVVEKDKATMQQRKKIFTVAKEKGISETDLRSMILDRYGTEHTSELTKQQASELIDTLLKLPHKIPPKSEPEQNELSPTFESEQDDFSSSSSGIVTDEKLKIEIRKLQNKLEWNDETLDATIRLVVGQDADLFHLTDAEAEKVIKHMQGIAEVPDKLL